jgi:hypothetical protein
MRTPRRVVVASVLAACSAAATEPLRLNPFGDPFVVATAGGPPCAAPLGPASSDAEIRTQSHQRAERGTSCWLAGRCSEPNAYRYDPRVAQAVVQALQAQPELADTRIWVTVERRIVTLEGCIAHAEQAALAETTARRTPDVDLVLPMLSAPGEAPRYRLAPGR